MLDARSWLRRATAWAIGAVLITGVAGEACAKVTLRRAADGDHLLFHGNYSMVPFDPATAFRLEIWNCADGAMPTFLSGREPLVICAPDPDGDHALADLVYAAEVPAGACNDHGRSCYYRDARAAARGDGVRYFRVRYAQRGRGNRVWLESYGDLSAAQHARMLLLVRIDAQPRAVLEDTFRPLPNGGWFSPY